MIESRSVVARGPGHGGRWLTTKEHKEIYWLIEMFYKTVIIVIAQLKPLSKTHQIVH